MSMKYAAEITHYKVDISGNTVYVDRKPTTTTTIVEFPLRFGYGSYNEPRKILNSGINSDDIISINIIEIP